MKKPKDWQPQCWATSCQYCGSQTVVLSLDLWRLMSAASCPSLISLYLQVPLQFSHNECISEWHKSLKHTKSTKKNLKDPSHYGTMHGLKEKLWDQPLSKLVSTTTLRAPAKLFFWVRCQRPGVLHSTELVNSILVGGENTKYKT